MVSAINADRLPHSDLPFTRQASRFVDMTVEREQWLSFFDEPPYGNAADMHIYGNMLARLPIKGRAIQWRVVGWRMKQKDGSVERFVAE